VIEKKEFIGVEQVKVPAYLMDSPIYVKRSDSSCKKIRKCKLGQLYG